jgi:phosphate transport system permease protein
VSAKAPTLAINRRKSVAGDEVFNFVLRSIAVCVLGGFAALTVFLAHSAWPAIDAAGAGFLWSSAWDPVTGEFGALAFLWGTVVSSLLALLLSAPVSIGAALFLTDLAPRPVRAPVAFLIEMLAAIPSVVYGIWGIFVLAPVIREYVHPLLNGYLGFLPIFEGPPFGLGMLSAAFVLAVMITPTITAVCREVFRSVPDPLREAAIGLGATRWETIRIAVLKPSVSGVFGAMILGLGRALGETMAVTMVIGNRPEISASLFKPAATMASVIANEYTEAQGDAHLSALAAIGLVLLLVSSLVNLGARWIIKKTESKTHV